MNAPRKRTAAKRRRQIKSKSAALSDFRIKYDEDGLLLFLFDSPEVSIELGLNEAARLAFIDVIVGDHPVGLIQASLPVPPRRARGRKRKGR